MAIKIRKFCFVQKYLGGLRRVREAAGDRADVRVRAAAGGEGVHLPVQETDQGAGAVRVSKRCEGQGQGAAA